MWLKGWFHSNTVHVGLEHQQEQEVCGWGLKDTDLKTVKNVFWNLVFDNDGQVTSDSAGLKTGTVRTSRYFLEFLVLPNLAKTGNLVELF